MNAFKKFCLTWLVMISDVEISLNCFLIKHFECTTLFYYHFHIFIHLSSHKKVKLDFHHFYHWIHISLALNFTSVVQSIDKQCQITWKDKEWFNILRFISKNVIKIANIPFSLKIAKVFKKSGKSEVLQFCLPWKYRKIFL